MTHSLLHPLVRVAQCERRGALERYVKRYLCERQTCVTFTIGSFEAEARGLAREICAAKAVSQ